MGLPLSPPDAPLQAVMESECKGVLDDSMDPILSQRVDREADAGVV